MKTSTTTSVLAGIALLLSGASASAAFINGSITFSGDFAPTGGTGLGDATGIDFLGDDFDVDGATGSFASEGIVIGDAGTINDFQFNPLIGTVNPLWAIDIFAFELEAINIDFQAPGFLILSGSGTVTGAGYDDTAGTWSLTANNNGSLFNFSSGTTVAEPASLALIGLGLLGFAASRRKRAN